MRYQVGFALRQKTHIVDQVEGCERGLEFVELVGVLHVRQRVGAALRQVPKVLGVRPASHLELQHVRQLRVQLGGSQQLRVRRVNASEVRCLKAV